MIITGSFHLQQLKGLREITEGESAQSNLHNECLGDSSSDPQAFLDHEKLADYARIRLVFFWFQLPSSPPAPPPAEGRVPALPPL